MSEASDILSDLASHLVNELQVYVGSQKVMGKDRWAPECSLRCTLREICLLPPELLDKSSWNPKKSCIQVRIDQKEQLVPLLGEEWWLRHVQTARVGGDMNSYQIHLPILLELSPTGDKMKLRMHGLEKFNLAGTSQWDSRSNVLGMKRVPKRLKSVQFMKSDQFSNFLLRLLWTILC
jgi:hypothetical protein